MSEPAKRFIFPRYANLLLPVGAVAVIGGLVYLPVLFGLGASPKTKDVGYAPQQPVQYSHALHVGRLGMDCRYCHYSVERAGFAAIPPTQVCMNCHTGIKPESERIKPVKQSWESGKPIPWVKVHDLPDYVYFNHSIHVNKGVGCVECHGRIDRMENGVRQEKPLSMSWCLDCHREPEKSLRPRDQVTNMFFKTDPEQGKKLKAEYGIRDASFMEACSTCHR